MSEPRRKYQFMQGNTERRGQGLREKIPDIQKTLDVVQLLKMRGVSCHDWLELAKLTF